MKTSIDSIMQTIRDRSTLSLDDNSSLAVFAWWQRALGLECWSIKLRRVRHWDMPTPDAVGSASYELSNRSGSVQLLEPFDYPDSITEVDEEQVIVHELLHFVFAPVQEGIGKATSIEKALFIEQPVDLLAKLLVALRRAPRGDMP